MKQLFTQEQYDTAKFKDKLQCECIQCSQSFGVEKSYIRKFLNGKKNATFDFCSTKCRGAYKSKCRTKHNCSQCGKEFERTPTQLKRPTKNLFCGSSCNMTYQNSHKTTGTRVSKLEKYLQLKLKELYPSLEFIFNSPTVVGLELDIYVPYLKLAFELNGIFHYEPIFGQDKLNRTTFNDQQKYQACISKNISLCVIDTSSQKYFKESTSQRYLDIISKIIKGVIDDFDIACPYGP